MTLLQYHSRMPQFFLTLTLLCIAPLAIADSSGAIASDAFSSARLARIDARMNEAVADGLMSGCQGVIAWRGDVGYAQNWGLADREAGVPTADDTLYRIYSMTKPVTSVALLMLYEQGYFLLSDPVAKYLPEFADVQVLESQDDGSATLRAPARPPTIRDLLRHTAGMSYGVFGDTPVDRRYREAALFRQDTLEEFAGTREMDATAIIDYFAPLMEYLKEQNANRECGW